MKAGLRPRITNTNERTFDDHYLSFESAGALEFVNEYSGFVVAPAHYIAFAELKHARPAALLYHCGSEIMKPHPEVEFAAFVGIDWSDTKHDICLQVGYSEEREFAVVPQGPLVDALQKYDFLVLFPVHPATLAKYREALAMRLNAHPPRSSAPLSLNSKYLRPFLHDLGQMQS